ncbi:Lysine-specific histone demethylase 1 -like protein 3 [Escovopsis weberi]|uniref:Lysine-specific histone demethylase 1-like protein 3 n=1 Tax=Escovopsis weberi TaxID=150374 RepID=A0A0M9VXE2_ESCWE|nr:Lysine-specific histone demethylase 1 -like protein 3 [Escovopsis weberi]
MPSRRHEAGPEPHVAVVGAGVAGLRCADLLLQHGFRVSIFEGRDRIGGRLHQQHLENGHLVDTGPNWFHGTDDNPILDLAKQTGTAVGVWDSKASLYDELGTLYSDKAGEEYSTVMWDIIQDAFQHSNQSCADIDPSLSLLDFFRERVKERIPDTEPGFEEKRDIVLRLSQSWGNFIGSPIAKQSLKFFWLEECIEGENPFCAGTFKKILEAIAKPALEGASIHFNSIAERVSYGGDQGAKVRIQFRGGKTLSFDEVVMTTPLGWLKRNPAAFEPPLPARFTNAIESIGFGCLEKVYISFPEAFWVATKENGNRGTQGFVHWLSPAYHADGNPSRWLQESVELATIAPEAAHPTLLFYLYGEQSEFITSSLAGLATADERHGFLARHFEPYYRLLPNYDAGAPCCRPSCSLATSWLRDELAGNGSYSNFQVGLSSGDEDIRVMREGLPGQGLWFAGEHTAPYVALGTVTGAYWSGETVGRRIAETHGLAKQRA